MEDIVLRNRLKKIRIALNSITDEVNQIYNDNLESNKSVTNSQNDSDKEWLSKRWISMIEWKEFGNLGKDLCPKCKGVLNYYDSIEAKQNIFTCTHCESKFTPVIKQSDEQKDKNK